MQRTWIWSLIQEDSTCHRATTCHKYWACVLRLLMAGHAIACALQQEKPLQWEAHAPQLECSLHSLPLEKAYVRQWRPNAKSLQSCPTLCNPIDGSPPGSPVPGILQARTLEWVAISFSNAWKWKVKWSCSVISNSSRPHGLQPTRLLHP